MDLIAILVKGGHNWLSAVLFSKTQPQQHQDTLAAKKVRTEESEISPQHKQPSEERGENTRLADVWGNRYTTNKCCYWCARENKSASI